MSKRTGSINVFSNALLRIIDSRLRANNCDGVVKDVDKTKFTCTVTVGETDFTEVPIRVLISKQASFVEIPAVNSSVVMTFRDANMARPQLLEVDECQEILIKIGNSTLDITDGLFKFNGGSHGIPKADEIKTQSEKDKDILDGILQVLQTPINEPGNGAPSAFQAALIAAIGTKQSGVWTGLENDKIKQ
jgi:hypothetical protein